MATVGNDERWNDDKSIDKAVPVSAGGTAVDLDNATVKVIANGAKPVLKESCANVQLLCCIVLNVNSSAVTGILCSAVILFFNERNLASRPLQCRYE